MSENIVCNVIGVHNNPRHFRYAVIGCLHSCSHMSSSALVISKDDTSLIKIDVHGE